MSGRAVGGQAVGGQAVSGQAVSLWQDSVAREPARAPLAGHSRFDVAIIGGGLTALWSAYYLSERDPTLSIGVLEKEFIGFGASGRNGGWCSALFPASTASLERRHGLDAALAMRRAMISTVDEVGRVTAAEGIDCDFVKAGTLVFARSSAQLAAAEADVAEAAGYGVDAITLLDASAYPGVSNAIGGTFDPDTARLHPAKLVGGLARVLEQRGIHLFEATEVLDWEPHRVSTTRGVVDCDTVIVATEGYGATLPKTRRSVLPLYSLMIATEPLSDAVWDDIGLPDGATFSDYRHLLIYGQRTADNRIAFGGRGARYHLGSTISPEYDSVPRVFDHLAATLGDLFPAAANAAITHRWGGPLGVPRDWHASAAFDAATGIARAGGYVGDGLSTTNLAGRTLADLITGTASTLTTLPWVGHRSPRWEPEPLRFIASNLGLAAMEFADAEESITHRSSIAAKIMAPLVGH